MANEMQVADANGLDSLDLNVDMIETVSLLGLNYSYRNRLMLANSVTFDLFYI